MSKYVFYCKVAWDRNQTASQKIGLKRFSKEGNIFLLNYVSNNRLSGRYDQLIDINRKKMTCTMYSCSLGS